MNMSDVNNIAIIGSGAFACAVYSTLRDIEDNKISMFFHDEDCYKYILENKKHPKMPCVFDNKTILTTKLEEAIKGKKTIFLCCIFAVACDVIDNIINIIGENADVNIVICCKGMLAKEPFFLCDYIEKKMPNSNVMVFSGGSFADEMCKKQNTFVNIACKNDEKATEILPIFDNFLHIKTTKYIHETELFGALKNVMAIYCGYLSKNGSTNELIGGLTEFLIDTKVFFANAGLNANCLISQAGIGDIMLTCLSGKSRNRTFGELLGNDKEKAKEYQKNTTIEGFDAMFAIKKMCDKKGIKFKTLDKIINIVNDVLS